MRFEDIPRNPSSRMLRQFAGLCLLVFGGLGGWRALGGNADPVAWLLVGLALLLGVGGLIRPAALRWIFVGWMIVVFPIGWLVSNLVLAILFFGLFTPVAWVMRLMGRDAMKLRTRGGESYWEAKQGSGDVRSYFRQS